MNRVAVELFLLGVVATLYAISGLFFLKFWRRTRDSLFLAFGASFLIQGINSASRALMPEPNQGSLGSFVIGLAASLLLVIAIIRKNVGGK